MDPVTIVTTGLALAKALIALSVDAGPVIAAIRAAIDSMLGKGHITDVQAADLHAQTNTVESDWQADLAAARAEAQDPPAI